MKVALPILSHTESASPLAGQPTGPRDIRSVRTLRISVTDRCNFRCVYCMPEDKLDWTPKASLLTFEEITTIAAAAIRHGIRGFKITGGEPLVRQELPRLIEMLNGLSDDLELSMTTNGALLVEHAESLRAAGLGRITISLDSLNPDTFERITRGARLADVLAGIDAAVAAGFGRPKINCVAMRGVNDTEFPMFAAMTLDHDVSVRFIEYMPLGRTALGGEYERRFVPEPEIRSAIEARFGSLVPADPDSGSGPARVFRIAGGKGRIGFISAMSRPFCETCNRLRLTAEGQLRSCLFDGGEVELRPILREMGRETAASELHQAFVNCVAFKPEVHSYFGNRQMSQIGG
ncbi:MAG TPA: GTP 3',8-cyclase MoaA [Phycisphaerae bacterium]|nr:GTP 3',8-cyclase MoaA [Phycisphaerae bacterium]HRW54659.1 GTP 3',8-cyclase MoaA [Phycisphaerae bacterium]